MREPRAFRPGVPELTAHIRHLNRVRAHRGMGTIRLAQQPGGWGVGGWGCRTVSLTSETLEEVRHRTLLCVRIEDLNFGIPGIRRELRTARHRAAIIMRNE